MNEINMTEVTTPVEEPKKVTVSGVVIDCKYLNVRAKTDVKSTSKMIIKAGDIVEINQKRSTGDWYSVKTSCGVYGYCMKKYIEIIEK